MIQVQYLYNYVNDLARKHRSGVELQQEITGLLARLSGPVGLEKKPADGPGAEHWSAPLVPRYMYLRAASIYGGSSEVQKDNLENVHGEKQKTKTKLEEEREKVTKQIQSMYQTTEDNVKTRLNNLEKENEERFAKAVVKFTEEFKTEVDTKVNAFLDERHSGWFGWARAAKDWLLGVDEMPEVKEAFETANEEQATKAACENPLKSIDTEIKSIIQYNNKVIQECKADLKKGKEDELFNSAWARLEEVSKLGTGAIEIKSGYGLTVEAELKMLRVIKKLKERSGLSIRSTF